MDKYAVAKEKLGQGSFGTVYRARRRADGCQVAVKRSKNDVGIPYTTLREVVVLKRLAHPNVIPLLDVVVTPSHTCLVFPLCPQTLADVIDEGGMKPADTRLCAGQILDGLAYIHQKSILHRDLKPSNILVDDRGNVRIADLGLACGDDRWRLHTAGVTTLWYRAPEILEGSVDYQAPADMWSFGCILVELATGKVAFPGESDEDQLHLVQAMNAPERSLAASVNQRGRQRLTSLAQRLAVLEYELALLISGALSYKPNLRPTAPQALTHIYFSRMEIDG
jgi:serine/threonine protein kinase